MNKAGVKRRDIKYLSRKNGGEMYIVHSDAARSYSKKLEEDSKVVSYSVCKPLISERLAMIQKTGIRKEYFEKSWETDFYIVYSDTSVAVREITSEKALGRFSEVVKLELSRRYWKAAGVTNWKIVITDKSEGGIN